jgi:hypothetical protein
MVDQTRLPFCYPSLPSQILGLIPKYLVYHLKYEVYEGMTNGLHSEMHDYMVLPYGRQSFCLFFRLSEPFCTLSMVQIMNICTWKDTVHVDIVFRRVYKLFLF